MNPVRMEVREGIAVIVIDNPPVNALSPDVVSGVIDAVRGADADPAVRAMVLMGAGHSFVAGADIRQFSKGVDRLPIGQRASDLLDQASKPIVAAIHGYALGGGLEYALACHYRIAVADARIGLPEVLIGAIPGGGGTQRLPRLIGPRAALDTIVSGRHIPAMEAVKLGLVDDLIVEGSDLTAAAIAYAQRIADVRPLRRVRDQTARLGEAKDDPDLFETKRRSIARRARNQRVPYSAIDAVEASCSLPFEEGLRFERKIFEELEASTESKALRYAFFTKRECSKLPDVPQDTQVAPIELVAVIGAGTMGAGIAITCADAGLPVKLLDSMPGALDESMRRIHRIYDLGVARGRLAAHEAGRRFRRIEAVQDYAALRDCDLVIESMYEDLDTKKAVFVELDAAMKSDAILLTNTSVFDIDLIASATRRPQSVAGAHFFTPANLMRLIEVINGGQTSASTLMSTVQFGLRLGKTCVVFKNSGGLVTRRSIVPLSNEMVFLLEEGALPEQVDRVMVEFGYSSGPFVVSDLAGLDIAHAIRVRRMAEYPDFPTLPIADRLVAMGRLGQKTGAGWYRYEDGNRMPYSDPIVAQVIDEQRRAKGIVAREIPDQEILRRLLFSSVNECCRIIAEGLVYRASDIDVAWIQGFGFPRYRGGLMFWADGIGVAEIYRQVSAWQQEFGARWAPAPLLKEIAESGGALHELRTRPRG